MSTLEQTKRIIKVALASVLLAVATASPAFAATYNCGTYGGGAYNNNCTQTTTSTGSSASGGTAAPVTPAADESSTPSDSPPPNQTSTADPNQSSTTGSSAAPDSAKTLSFWKIPAIGFSVLLILLAILWAILTWRRRHTRFDQF